jgi:hypothetical protein
MPPAAATKLLSLSLSLLRVAAHLLCGEIRGQRNSAVRLPHRRQPQPQPLHLVRLLQAERCEAVLGPGGQLPQQLRTKTLPKRLPAVGGYPGELVVIRFGLRHTEGLRRLLSSHIDPGNTTLGKRGG